MKDPLDHIHLQGIECRAQIGVTEQERSHHQRLLIDLALGLDLEPAGHADRLELSLDYSAVVSMVQRAVEQSCFELVEALAYHLMHALLALPRVEEATLEIHKFPADLQGQVEQVSVKIHRRNPGS